jgi:hypothetical protein
MKRKELSPRETKRLYERIKSDLEKAGFTTNWRQPFFAWMHPEWGRSSSDDTDDPRGLYVSLIPVPTVVPYDFAEAHIHLSSPDRLRFSLNVYFTRVFDQIYQPQDFNAIVGVHDAAWFPALRHSLRNVQRRFSLYWDTEYDCQIEDSLNGILPVRQRKKIVEILSAMRELPDEAFPETGNVVPFRSREVPAGFPGEDVWQIASR